MRRKRGGFRGPEGGRGKSWEEAEGLAAERLRKTKGTGAIVRWKVRRKSALG